MMEITPLGDSALIVHIRDGFKDAPEQTVNEVLAAMQRLEAAKIPGIIELTSAYTTVGVSFDPVRVVDSGAKPDAVIDWLSEKINGALGTSRRWPGRGFGMDGPHNRAG